MECCDLGRYLEAFVDGRLGRSRGAILRRHLVACGACQARVERLRQFERDMQRRFRALEQAGSVWQGLELDLVVDGRSTVAGGLPALTRYPPPLSPSTRNEPRRPRPHRGHPVLTAHVAGRSKASRVAGVLLIALAVGSIYQLARSYGGPPDDIEAAASAYLQFLRDAAQPALRSGDVEQLRAWLSAELGTGIPAPPLPEGYRLVGAELSTLASGAAGALIYAGRQADDAAPVMLFVRPRPAAAGAPPLAAAPAVATADKGGLHELAWDAGGFSYTLVGQQPSNELRTFTQ